MGGGTIAAIAGRELVFRYLCGFDAGELSAFVSNSRNSNYD
jgi:hypothetical protein